MHRRIGRELQHLQPCGEFLDSTPIRDLAARFFCAVKKFCEGNRGYRQFVGEAIKPSGGRRA
jgi:hypothetical protein